VSKQPWVTPALAHAIAQASIDHGLSTDDVCAWLVAKLDSRHVQPGYSTLTHGRVYDGPALVPLVPPPYEPLNA
jgi:hypothetical protein